ncbi:MAG: hypothetical protein ACI4UX_01365 [Clostridia bacterium]
MNYSGYLVDNEGNKYYPDTNDSGWKTATLQNCTANSNGLGGYPGIVYKKIGKRVIVEGAIIVTFTGPTIVLTNLPVRI